MDLLFTAVRVKIFLSFFREVGCRFTQNRLLSKIKVVQEADKVYYANHAPY